MQSLNLPQYAFKIKKVVGEKKQIFCSIRKKYVSLQPEEWVRQNFTQFLIQEKSYPASLIVFEYPLKYNSLKKRGDIVLFDQFGLPFMLVECKSYDVPITQAAFDQAARYNMSLKLNYLIVTNGLNHYCCYIDHQQKKFSYLEDIPDYKSI